MKALSRDDTTFRLDALPKLKHNSFDYYNMSGFTGSIAKRKLKTQGGVYSHYGFFYGLDENDIAWMIENNEDGVECVTWNDFSKGQSVEFIHYEPNLDRFDEIMGRAYERRNEIYDAAENNCEHFANYAVNGQHESFQSDMTKKFVDILISAVETRIIISPSSEDHELLKDFNDIRETFKLKRDPKFQKIVDKRISKKPRQS